MRYVRRIQVPLLAAVLLAACASIPPDRQVLNTLDTIKASSISTMTVIGNLYQQGQVSEAQKAEAILVYNKIQASCKAVAAAASTVTSVQQGADLIAPIQQLSSQLAALLVQFQTGGVK